MNRRVVLQVGALVWAVVGASVALVSFGSVNPEARPLVGVFSVLGPLAAVGAARVLARGGGRSAGALLLVSVLTPTYFAYVINVPALLAGVALAVAPQVVSRAPVNSVERADAPVLR
jgi:hypothetical protein